MTSGFQIPAAVLASPTHEIVRVRQPEHEKLVDCVGCNQLVMVCGYVDDLPSQYVCLDCRTTIEEALELGQAIDQARQAQESGV